MWADQVGPWLALHLHCVRRWPSLCVDKPTQMQKQDMVLGAGLGQARGASVAGLPVQGRLQSASSQRLSEKADAPHLLVGAGVFPELPPPWVTLVNGCWARVSAL